MFDDFELDLILDQNNYPKIYRPIYIIFTIIILFLIIIIAFNYQSYLIIYGIFNGYNLEVYSLVDDLNYIQNNNKLEIDGIDYSYRIDEIVYDAKIDSNYRHYHLVYLNIFKYKATENYIYKLKIPKENKKLSSYIIDYFK